MRVAALVLIASAALLVPAPAAADPPLSVKLSGGLAVSGFEITPDGTTVVFEAGGLWVVPIDGSEPPLSLGPGASIVGITADGARVVWGTSKLFSVPIDGSEPSVELSGPLTHCSATGVACGTAADCSSTGTCLNGGQLCETDLDCAGALNPCTNVQPESCDESGVVTFLPGPRIAQDSSRVVYVADEETDQIFDVFSVPIDGSAAPVKLNDPLPHQEVTAGLVPNLSVQIDPDSTHVVYFTDQEIADLRELYSVPLDGGGAPVKLNGPLVPGGEIHSHFPTGDGTLVYLADQDTDEVREIYVVPLDGSASPIELNDPIAGPGVTWMALSSNGAGVIYQAVGELQQTGLFSVSLDAGAAPIRLTPPLNEGDSLGGASYWGGPVVGFWLTFDGEQCCPYRTVPVDGSAESVEVIPASAIEGLDIVGMAIHENRLVYRTYPESPPGEAHWFTVPTDGSQPPTLLHDLVAPFHHALFLGSHGAEGVWSYTAESELEFAFDLYVVPVTGSLPPVRVNTPLTSGEIEDWRLNPDGTWVVYEAIQDNPFRELYSHHIDLDADGVPDETDNCRYGHNPDQDPVVFGQTVVAASKSEFTWATTVDEVHYARGPLASVASYATDASGSLTDVVAFEDASVPTAGEGVYYLFRLNGECTSASWQSLPQAEPARDANLP